MKVIELLNRIANGEEVPKKIRFNNIEWNKVYVEKNVYYIDEYDSNFFLYLFRHNLDFSLNDEVEVIEEDKNIEKIGIINFCENPVEIILHKKIDEIIDYIMEDK